MEKSERTGLFLAVKCKKCGRPLRAKLDQVNTEIRCWDCHEMVLVPDPNPGQRVVRELSDNALVVIRGPGLNSVLLASAIVTLTLCIPFYGPWLAVVPLTLCASVFGEVIRRVSVGSSSASDEDWLRSLRPLSILKGLLCGLLAAGTVIPLWILNSAPHQSPHWDATGLALAATTWLVMPWLMMSVYGQKPNGASVGPWKGLRLILRHPIASLLAVSIIPLTLVVLEVALALIFYIPGDLPFVALDFTPLPQTPIKVEMLGALPITQGLDYRTVPDEVYNQNYLRNVRHGYSFVAAIPASLANSTRNGLDPELMGLTHLIYAGARFFCALIIVTCLTAAFAVQARWLGSIPASEKGRLV